MNNYLVDVDICYSIQFFIERVVHIIVSPDSSLISSNIGLIVLLLVIHLPIVFSVGYSDCHR